MTSRASAPHSSLDFHRASLSLCALSPPADAAAAAAALWHNRLLSLGAAPPLFVTHDLGWALTLPVAERSQPALLREPGAAYADRRLAAAYGSLIRELVDSAQPLAEVLGHCRDEVRSALLSYLLLPLCRSYARAGLPALPAPVDLPVAASAYPPPARYDTAFATSRDSGTDLLSPARAFAQFLVAERLRLRTLLELIDLDALRLLAAAPARSARAGLSTLSEDPMLHMPDLMSILHADVPDVRDIIRFSQDLLPAALEPQHSHDRQRYPIGGHASIERQGSIDSLLGSELVFDDTLFLHRLADGEALYYGRERTPDRQLGPVQILVDASASMRGQRQVFARGLAWALARRLSSRREVSLRFFDGRLHEPQAFTAGPRPTGTSEAPLALLSFRSERGRNYQRVFSDLLRELRGQRQKRIRDARDPAGRPTLHIVTHGECHVPPRMMQDLAEHADLYAVFVMPSGPLQVDYLPWLAGYQVVDEALLDQRDERRRTALGIIDRAAEQKARA